MIPRERALVVVRKMPHHWVPISERSLKHHLGRILPLALPFIGKALGVAPWIQAHLDRIGAEAAWRICQDTAAHVGMGLPGFFDDDDGDEDAFRPTPGS